MVGGIQGTEWIMLILIIVFFLFGAKKLPELARGIGKATGEFERGKLEIQREMGLIDQAVKAPVAELRRTVAQVAPTTSYVPPANPASTATPTPPPSAPSPVTPTVPAQPQSAPVSSAAAEAAPEADEQERVFRAAKELGIDVENKSIQQLKEEITKTMLK